MYDCAAFDKFNQCLFVLHVCAVLWTVIINKLIQIILAWPCHNSPNILVSQDCKSCTRILLIEDAMRQQFVLGSRGSVRHNEGNAVFRG